MRKQRVAVAAANGARELRQILVEGAEHLQYRVLVGEEHVAPHGRVRRGDTGEIAKAAGGEFQHFRARHFGKLVGRADDRIGDEMRQMTGDRQHEVVMRCRHGLDVGAQSAPESRELFDCGGIGAFGRRQDAPSSDEQCREAGIGAGILRAGHRMGGDKMNAIGQVRSHVADDRALDRADIRNSRAAHQMRSDLGGDFAAGADRHAYDHEIGAGDGGGAAFHDLIGKAKLGDTLARRGGAGSRHDLAHRSLRPRRAGNRRADQADADQSEAVV